MGAGVGNGVLWLMGLPVIVGVLLSFSIVTLVVHRLTAKLELNARYLLTRVIGGLLMYIAFVEVSETPFTQASPLLRKILLSMVMLCSVSIVADEDRAFAESFLSAIYTEDDAAYRFLLHSSLKQCANRYWTDDNTLSEGHICHRKIMASFNAMLARDDGDWKIADVCFTEDDVQRLAKQRQDGDRKRELPVEERQRTVNEIYRNLSAQQRERLNSMLGGHIAYIIPAYSEELSVDQDTAYDLLSKMCSEYSEP